MTDKEVKEMEEALARHYGDEVRPIKEVCGSIFTWLESIRAEHLSENNVRDTGLHEIAKAFNKVQAHLFIDSSKSNLLYRLLYLRQEFRIKKCPVHEGHWSGYAFGSQCVCCVGLDITGWLPE